jgi:hypothetical protein
MRKPVYKDKMDEQLIIPVTLKQKLYMQQKASEQLTTVADYCRRILLLETLKGVL